MDGLKRSWLSLNIVSLFAYFQKGLLVDDRFITSCVSGWDYRKGPVCFCVCRLAAKLFDIQSQKLVKTAIHEKSCDIYRAKGP